MDFSMMQLDYMQFIGEDFSFDFTAMFNAMDITATCSGTMNYYNDDLLLTFTDVSYTIKNGTISGAYNFTMMDNKYSVKIDFSFPIGDMLAEDYTGTVDTTELFRGSIINSDNEQIGVFVVYNNDSVQILDNSGNTVKTAG
jgi:hypothetical protein